MMKRAWNLDCDPSPIEGPCPLYCDWTVAGYWPTTWDVDSTEASLDGNQQNHVAEGEAKGSLNEEHRSDVRLSVIVDIHKKKLFNQLAPHKKKTKQKSYYGSEGSALAASSGCRRFRISVLAISWRICAPWDAAVASVLSQIWLDAQTLFLLIRVVASCIF